MSIRKLLGFSWRKYLAGPKRRSKEQLRAFYNQMSEHMTDVTFMNYGYAADHEKGIPPDQCPDYFSFQLYRHVVGGVDLADKKVLEVSCGGGAGADYLAGMFHRRSVTAIDFSFGNLRKAQNFFSANHGLHFSVGDAESLPFGENQFDDVVNVEAAVCYDSRKRFFSEVHRVLKKGGWFLYCDILKVPYDPSADITRSKMCIEECQDITENVIKALELDSNRRAELAEHYFQGADVDRYKAWAGVKGYRAHRTLVERKRVYKSFKIRKP